MVKEKKYNACLYLRLSREDDNNAENESNSIQNQKRMLTEYVDNNSNIELTNVRVDDGYSGANFNRPAFKEMLQDIYDKKINCVIVKDFSRLGRDYIETNRYLQEIFPSFDVRFISLAENYDTLNPNNSSQEDMMNFLSIFNDNYCRDISIKVRSAYEIKRKTGNLHLNHPPYGYKKVNKEIQVDEEVRQVIEDIFDMKLQGYNQQQIANNLNEKGVLSPFEYSKKVASVDVSFVVWSAKTVKRILTNEFYIGNLSFGKTTTKNHKTKTVTNISKDDWVVTENNHEPIIKKSDFLLVNSLFDKDIKVSLDTQKVSLFSGLLFCADCGGILVKSTTKKKTKSYSYYMCNTNKTTKKCSAHRISCNKLYDVVLIAIQDYLKVCHEELDELVNIITVYSNEKSKELNNSIIDFKVDIKKLEETKSNLTIQLKNNIINKQDFLQLSEFYDNKLSKLKKEQERTNNDIREVILTDDEISAFVECIKENQTITFLSRFLILRLISKIIIQEDKKIEIFFKYNHFQDEGVESDG